MDSCHPETGILADNEKTMEKSISLPVPPHYTMTSVIFEVLVAIPILPLSSCCCILHVLIITAFCPSVAP